jgi:hypothetical protein
MGFGLFLPLSFCLFEEDVLGLAIRVGGFRMRVQGKRALLNGIAEVLV